MKPIDPITLEDASKARYAFMPQSDMTGIESALLCQLFMKMTLNRSGDALDWPQYVVDHRLSRHFTILGGVVTAGSLNAPTPGVVAAGSSDVPALNTLTP